MSPAKQFTEEEKNAMVEAIREAESHTSGEIRVHIENHCPGNVLDRATRIFAQLEMHKTALRNGVLFYIALQDKQLAILGDAGINANVPSGFWNTLKNELIIHFKQGKITEGICQGVRQAGIQLKQFFPRQKDDINELFDEISFK